MTIHRVVGDHGALARIRILGLKDADGQPITSGTVTLRADGLFEGAMSHTEDGNWHYDPAPDDLDTAGRYRLEVRVDGSQVTVPGETAWTLRVRAAVEAPV